MAQELGTKEVLEQLSERVGNVEQDIRAFRSEVKQDIGSLRSEVNSRFAGVDQRITWVYGLLVTVLLAVVGLWFK